MFANLEKLTNDAPHGQEAVARWQARWKAKGRRKQQPKPDGHDRRAAMHVLIPYLLRQKRALLLALGLAAVNQIFSLLDPLIFRHVIDRYATRYDHYGTGEFLRGVSLLLAAAVGVALVSRIAKNFQDYYVNLIVQRTGAALYTDGVRHSLDLPYEAFEDQRSGETLGKLNKVRSDVERFLNSMVNTVYTTLIGFVFVMAYAATVHWAIAPIYLLTIVALGWVSITLGQRIKAAQKKIVGETTALAGATTESLRNIELVKSLGLAAQETGAAQREPPTGS